MLVAAIVIAGWALATRHDAAEGAAKSYLTVAELNLQGWMLLDHRDAAFFPSALVMFNEALRQEPRSVSAHAGKAVLYVLKADEPRALEEAGRISQIDPQSGVPFAIRGFIRMMYHWDWPQGGALLNDVLVKGCPDPFCHQWYGLYLGLTGHTSQALREGASAVEMNPSRLAARAQFGQLLYWSSATSDAIRELQTAVDAGGNSTHARLDLWKAQLAAGDAVGAGRTVLLAREPSWYRLSPSDEFIQLAAHRELLGKPEFFRDLLSIEERIHGSTYFGAELAMAAGEHDRALGHLDHSLAMHDFFLPFAKRDPLFAPLHGNARYEAIMSKVGL